MINLQNMVLLPKAPFSSSLIKRKEPGDFCKSSLTQTIKIILEVYWEYWVLLHVRCYRAFVICCSCVRRKNMNAFPSHLLFSCPLLKGSFLCIYLETLEMYFSF